MRFRSGIVICGWVFLLHATSLAQVDEEAFETKTERWRIGVIVTAGDAPATGVIMSCPIPQDWPEQTVKQIDQELSKNVQRVTQRTLNAGVRQMIVTVPRLAAGESATAVMTYDVTKRFLRPLVDTGGLEVPQRMQASIRKYLAPSPYIESSDPRMRSVAIDVVDTDQPAWEQVNAIYDWVREHIRYEFSPHIKSGLQALDDRVGDCEELTSVFVAFCRANKIPARSVWVPNHCYPEFYLVDGQGKGHWIPCQAAGQHAFGHIPESRPILQKGDSFRVQGYRERLRYVRPTLIVRNTKASPTLQWVMKKIEP